MLSDSNKEILCEVGKHNLDKNFYDTNKWSKSTLLQPIFNCMSKTITDIGTEVLYRNIGNGAIIAILIPGANITKLIPHRIIRQ